MPANLLRSSHDVKELTRSVTVKFRLNLQQFD